jgi:hypothetical protein
MTRESTKSTADVASNKLDEVWDELNKLKDLVMSNLSLNQQPEHNSVPPRGGNAAKTPKNADKQATAPLPIHFKTFVKREIQRHDQFLEEKIIAPYVEKEIANLEARILASLQAKPIPTGQQPKTAAVFSTENVQPNDQSSNDDQFRWELAEPHKRVLVSYPSDEHLHLKADEERLHGKNKVFSRSAPDLKRNITTKSLMEDTSDLAEVEDDMHTLVFKLKEKMERQAKLKSRDSSANVRDRKLSQASSRSKSPSQTANKKGKSTLQMSYARPTIASTSKARYPFL